MVNPMNLRQAPRRKVVDIYKTGNYGNVQWHHRLECGHVESRSRKAPAEEIGCRQCGSPEERGRGGTSIYDPEVAREVVAQQTQAGLAAQFNVPLEQVEVMVTLGDFDRPVVSYATITLTKSELTRFAF